MLTRLDNLRVYGVRQDGTRFEVALDAKIIYTPAKEQASVKESVGELFEQIRDKVKEHIPIGPVSLELGLENTEILPSDADAVPIVAVVFEGQNRGFEYVVNLRLAGGHILENALNREAVFRQVITEGFDWREVLSSQPGRELSQEDFENLRKSSGFRPLSVSLKDLKRYLRLVITQKTEGPGASI